MSQLPPYTDPPPPMPGGSGTRSPAPSPRPARPARPDGPSPARPPATWKAWQVIAIYLLVYFIAGSIVFGFAVSAFGTGGDVTVGANLVIDVILLASLYAFIRRRPDWRRTMGELPPGRALQELGRSAALGVVLYALSNLVVGVGLSFVIKLVIGRPPPAPQQLPTDLSGLGVALAVVFAVVVAPITEEFFFRGCLFRALRDRFGFWIGALGSAGLFGLVHVPINGGMIAATVLLQGVMLFTGLGFAFIYERRGTLPSVIAAHMAFNAIGMTLILAAR